MKILTCLIVLYSLSTGLVLCIEGDVEETNNNANAEGDTISVLNPLNLNTPSTTAETTQLSKKKPVGSIDQSAANPDDIKPAGAKALTSVSTDKISSTRVSSTTTVILPGGAVVASSSKVGDISTKKGPISGAEDVDSTVNKPSSTEAQQNPVKPSNEAKKVANEPTTSKGESNKTDKSTLTVNSTSKKPDIDAAGKGIETKKTEPKPEMTDPLDDEDQSDNFDGKGGAAADEPAKGVKNDNDGGSLGVSINVVGGNFALYPQDEDSHFFAYFTAAIFFCALGYIVFHNKRKVLALIVEGRESRPRRVLHGATYRRLDANNGVSNA